MLALALVYIIIFPVGTNQKNPVKNEKNFKKMIEKYYLLGMNINIVADCIKIIRLRKILISGEKIWKRNLKWN